MAPIALVSIVSLVLLLFGGFTTIGAEPVDESILAIFRQRIVIDYAEDRTLCQSLIREWADYDDDLRTHYHLTLLPGGEKEDPFEYDQPPGESSSLSTWHYRRGRFDFDNDGVTDLVIGVREGGDRYFILPNTPKPGADLPEDEQPAYEPWPHGFGLDWLSTHSRYVFPDMWWNHGTYTLRQYELTDLYSEPFRLRGVTYILLVPDSAKDLGALLRPKPNKVVEDACVFKRASLP